MIFVRPCGFIASVRRGCSGGCSCGRSCCGCSRGCSCGRSCCGCSGCSRGCCGCSGCSRGRSCCGCSRGCSGGRSSCGRSCCGCGRGLAGGCRAGCGCGHRCSARRRCTLFTLAFLSLAKQRIGSKKHICTLNASIHLFWVGPGVSMPIADLPYALTYVGFTAIRMSRMSVVFTSTPFPGRLAGGCGCSCGRSCCGCSRGCSCGRSCCGCSGCSRGCCGGGGGGG